MMADQEFRISDETPYQYQAMSVDEAEKAGLLHAPPCKHEWRQYMTPLDAALVLDCLGVPGGGGMHDLTLVPAGFFCIHCPAKSDEDRVITNPEAL